MGFEGAGEVSGCFVKEKGCRGEVDAGEDDHLLLTGCEAVSSPGVGY